MRFKLNHLDSLLPRPHFPPLVALRRLADFLKELKTFLLHGEAFLCAKFGVDVNEKLQARHCEASSLMLSERARRAVLWAQMHPVASRRAAAPTARFAAVCQGAANRDNLHGGAR